MKLRDKIDKEFILSEYNSPESVRIYSEAAIHLGLMNSERLLFEKYLNRSDNILDLGCGSGRIAFGLYQNGYQNVCGLDISIEQIRNAVQINLQNNYWINFSLGDGEALPFKSNFFDCVIFSFNGLMTTPTNHSRQQICHEVARVLKKQGLFIFTTHDRNQTLSSRQYWAKQRDEWLAGNSDLRYVDFGDRIFSVNGKETYIHIPDRPEVQELMHNSGFSIIFSKLRSEISKESSAKSNFSDDCVFWIAVKDKGSYLEGTATECERGCIY